MHQNENNFTSAATDLLNMTLHDWHRCVGGTILNNTAKNETIRLLCIHTTGAGKTLP